MFPPLLKPFDFIFLRYGCCDNNGTQQIWSHVETNIEFVGQSSHKCCKISLNVSQRSSTASGNHREHLVSTLAMFILRELLAINRLNPRMPWPYLEWNILSSLLVDLLSIKHPVATDHWVIVTYRKYSSSLLSISDKSGSTVLLLFTAR